MNYPPLIFFRIKCKEFEVGKKVYAVIKASNVMVGTDE